MVKEMRTQQEPMPQWAQDRPRRLTPVKELVRKVVSLDARIEECTGKKNVILAQLANRKAELYDERAQIDGILEILAKEGL